MTTPDDEPPKGGGILVPRGMGLSIPAGALTISMGPDGLKAELLTVHVRLSMWLYWLEIAMFHLDEAQTQNAALLQARDDGGDVGGPLEAEFRAAMQAVVAAAIAIDSLYALVKDKIKVPADLTECWRQKRRARYVQVTEIFRLAFCLKKQGTANVRGVMKEIYRFRDLAVHPQGTSTAPVLHPDLGSATEWRFVTFRFENARQVVRAAIAYVKILPSRPMDRATEPMQQLAKDLLSLGEPLFSAWDKRYGALLDDLPPTEPT
ncbi:MAG: hypothetical protein ACLP5H_21695 [Desulfomonilaceae bacterium]